MGKTSAVVYAFAVELGVPPTPGAAAPEVLARQLPRLIVSSLNDGGDRGARFVPFLVRHGGARRFLTPRVPLAPDAALTLHGRDPHPDVVVHGCIGRDVLRLCVLRGDDGHAVLDCDLPFSPAEPMAAVRRMLFEILGALAWASRRPHLPELGGPALAAWLVARDELLALEADLPGRDLAAAGAALEEAVRRAPAVSAVQELAIELGAALARAGQSVAPALVAAAAGAGDGAAAMLARAARALAAAGDPATGELWLRVAALDPLDVEAAWRAGLEQHRRGDLHGAKDLLHRAVAGGVDDPLVVAQLAALAARLGDPALRQRCHDTLLARSELPIPVVRYLAAALVAAGGCDAALTIIDRALGREPTDPALWLERGRAALGLRRDEEARQALLNSLRQRPAVGIAEEARHLLRFTAAPRLLDDLRAVEDALATDRPQVAVQLCLEVLRRAPELGEAWLLLGVARQRRRQRRRAERAFRRALRCSPELAEAHHRLGTLLLCRGRHQDAYTHLRAAVERMPAQASPRLHLAQACRCLGREAEGLAELAMAERFGAAAEDVAVVRRAFSASA